jgi:hypothetical protein
MHRLRLAFASAFGVELFISRKGIKAEKTLWFYSVCLERLYESVVDQVVYTTSWLCDSILKNSSSEGRTRS